MALWVHVLVGVLYAAAVLVPCLFAVRIVRRERRMVSGMLAASRENRADSKRFAEEAKKAAGAEPLALFVRDL